MCNTGFQQSGVFSVVGTCSYLTGQLQSTPAKVSLLLTLLLTHEVSTVTDAELAHRPGPTQENLTCSLL